MHLTRITSAKKAGFSKKNLRTRKDMPKQTIAYMKQKSSFLIAVISLAAFITGNMVGEHGFYAFWKAALGQSDDSLITYTGTVPPVAYVPDYSKWSTYGGNPEQNTYRQVPQDLLVPLPAYNENYEKTKGDSANADVYSVGYMGDYSSGEEGQGSHPGVDIRVPIGTPVRSIANGVVEAVKNDATGFGLYIVIRNPHMPDPANPQYETVLHSVYAHLSSQLVAVGDVVQKGQQIGLSGMTGDATGPHLHFQIDRDTAPWHPYWPFSGDDLRAANLSTLSAINSGFHQSQGYEYTVNPVLLAQADYPSAKYKTAAPATTVASNTTIVKTQTVAVATTPKLTEAQLVAQRLAARLAKLPVAPTPTQTVATTAPVVQTTTVVSDTQSTPVLDPAPVIVAPAPATPVVVPVKTVSTIGIETTSRYKERTWQTVRLTLKDANGQTISGDSLSQKIYMRTAYGDAEFNPAILSGNDFKNGVATVQMLPRGRQTVVIQIQPLNILSGPIQDGGN
jgi:murein DD-endopeptidase MepM/ murein hydrolase activator NlpD